MDFQKSKVFKETVAWDEGENSSKKGQKQMEDRSIDGTYNC